MHLDDLISGLTWWPAVDTAKDLPVEATEGEARLVLNTGCSCVYDRDRWRTFCIDRSSLLAIGTTVRNTATKAIGTIEHAGTNGTSVRWSNGSTSTVDRLDIETIDVIEALSSLANDA